MNYSNVRGKVIGDLEGIGELYNSEEYMSELKDMLEILKEWGNVIDFVKRKAFREELDRKSNNESG